LQEAEEWAKSISTTARSTFSNAAISTVDPDSDGSSSGKLGFSRAYSLALAPHIIYTRSSLLPLLVSSRSDQQLEFLAVGSWFVYTAGQNGTLASLARVPGSREDLFADQSIEPRAKRSLMKFLRFVGDFENQSDWQEQADTPFHSFLSSRFGLPPAVQAPFAALTLSPNPPDATTVAFALPRVARHLRSMGLFGPGFGAVVPKWGGLAEIAQVGCRAGAVGGAVYVLGTGLATDTSEQGLVTKTSDGEGEASHLGQTQLNLTNGDVVKTKWLAGSLAALPQSATSAIPSSTLTVSRCIAIVSSPLKSLFPAMAEGAPQPAVAVVVFPSSSLEAELDSPPIHLFVHSSETGECPPGQCKLPSFLSFTIQPSSMMTQTEYITYIVCNYIDEKLSDKLIAITIILVTITSTFCHKHLS
jgi:RAB protein geranylgeranyltransferase component A